MIPEEFAATFHVRHATGPRSCTGAEPCVHSAVAPSGAWYCRFTMQTSGRRMPLGGNPDRVVCDRHAPYRVNPFHDPGATPSVG